MGAKTKVVSEISRARQVAILSLLGEKNAKRWAEDGPQSLRRWLLLTAFWRCVVTESDTWQRHWAKGHAVDSAITRILAKGVSAEDLTLVVRQMQIDALFNAVQVLDHPSHGIEDLQEKITGNVEWRVASFDGESESVGARLGELHGTFLNLDPEGRMGEPPALASKTSVTSKKKPKAAAKKLTATKKRSTSTRPR
jgi:hypothetical protein